LVKNEVDGHFLVSENARPTSKQLTHNKQLNKFALKNVSFFVMLIVIFAPLTANISASGQNIFKYLVAKLLGKDSIYLHAKN